jgi:hypothetical protein
MKNSYIKHAFGEGHSLISLTLSRSIFNSFEEIIKPKCVILFLHEGTFLHIYQQLLLLQPLQHQFQVSQIFSFSLTEN